MDNKLELRMYGLVPYNISPIQQAIQFGHAVVEYGLPYIIDEGHTGIEEYIHWSKYWKTFIILNGGTSNHMDSCRYENPFVNPPSEVSGRIIPESGSMEKNYKELLANKVNVGVFYEPDLNDMLSAIVFLVDERVFNKDKYPDFFDSYWKANKGKSPGYGDLSEDPLNPKFINTKDADEWKSWVQSIGGKKNLFLRYFLKNFRLA